MAGIALVIAGDGPAEGELRERARGADVRFAGRVDDAQLARLRDGAALALAPSRSAETFALAAAEAMAAGLPVAASRVGALPELVGEEGLVPAGDALRAGGRDRAPRRRSRGGRAGARPRERGVRAARRRRARWRASTTATATRAAQVSA